MALRWMVRPGRSTGRTGASALGAALVVCGDGYVFLWLDGFLCHV